MKASIILMLVVLVGAALATPYVSPRGRRDGAWRSRYVRPYRSFYDFNDYYNNDYNGGDYYNNDYHPGRYYRGGRSGRRMPKYHGGDYYNDYYNNDYHPGRYYRGGRSGRRLSKYY